MFYSYSNKIITTDIFYQTIAVIKELFIKDLFYRIIKYKFIVKKYTAACFMSTLLKLLWTEYSEVSFHEYLIHLKSFISMYLTFDLNETKKFFCWQKVLLSYLTRV